MYIHNMREIGIEWFKRAMAEEIQNLPLAVTRRGKIIFEVIQPHGSEVKSTNHMIQPHGSCEKPTKRIVKPHGSENLKVESKQIIEKLREEVASIEPYKAKTHHRGE